MQSADVSPVLTSRQGLREGRNQQPRNGHDERRRKGEHHLHHAGLAQDQGGNTRSTRRRRRAIRSNRLDVCVPAHGASGCGAPPAEDDVRTPPHMAVDRRRRTPAKHHAEETNRRRKQPVAAVQRAVRQPDRASPLQHLDADAVHQGSGTTALLVLESVTSKRLLLKLTGPGTATVQIARQTGSKHHLAAGRQDDHRQGGQGRTSRGQAAAVDRGALPPDDRPLRRQDLARS